jgi:hypothetical protein
MLREVASAKHAILYDEVTSAKHAWLLLEKIWMRQMGRLEKKIAAVVFVLTAFISFGLLIFSPTLIALLMIATKDMFPTFHEF